MKTLLLLRHGKSSRDDPLQPDHDRPLKKRGRNEVQTRGRWMLEQNLIPDLILCSTSVRTMETMHWLTGEWRITPERRIHQELYHADARQIFRHVYHLPERFSVVLMVGHNPGFEQFVSLFSEKQEVLPTTSLAVLEFDVCNWSELTEKSRLKTIAVFRPRELS